MKEEVKVEVVDKRRIKSADDTYDESLDAGLAANGGASRPSGFGDPNEAKLREFMALYAEKMAEMDRVRKRLEAEAEDRSKRKFGALVADLLPILDDMDRAITHADGAVDDSFVTGLRKLRDGFFATLSARGLMEIDCADQPFDPQLAQAVAVTVTEDEAFDNIVVEQYAPGYAYEGQVLRHAIVRVARKD